MTLTNINLPVCVIALQDRPWMSYLAPDVFSLIGPAGPSNMLKHLCGRSDAQKDWQALGEQQHRQVQHLSQAGAGGMLSEKVPGGVSAGGAGTQQGRQQSGTSSSLGAQNGQGAPGVLVATPGGGGGGGKENVRPSKVVVGAAAGHKPGQAAAAGQARKVRRAALPGVADGTE
jgi:hypothetical protein